MTLQQYWRLRRSLDRSNFKEGHKQMEARLGIQFWEGTRKPKRVGVIIANKVAAYLSIQEVLKMASDLDHLEVALEFGEHGRYDQEERE